MLKFPLKKDILLITEAGDFICKINYAGENTLILHDVYKRIYSNENRYHSIDIFVSRELFIEREKSCGYSNLENEYENAMPDENDRPKKKVNKIKEGKILYLEEFKNGG